MIDSGHGPAFVLVPGIQGRWEWMATAVDALTRRARVVAFSWCDEPASGFVCDEQLGFEAYLRQLDEVFDRARLERAVIVGVSYGGLAAFEWAARRPARVAGLVLVSALPVDWRPDPRTRFYLRAPRMLSPLFFAAVPFRLYPEIAAACPQIGARLRFVAAEGVRVLRAPLSPRRMARRVRWAEAHRFAPPSAIEAPTLVITGENGLDRIVPPSETARCARGMRNVRSAVLPRTGHIGSLTRPDAFADLLVEFARRDCGLDCAPGETCFASHERPRVAGGWRRTAAHENRG